MVTMQGNNTPPGGPQCFPVSSRALAPCASSPFSAYLLRDGEFVLYITRGEAIRAEKRAALAEAGVDKVWIPKEYERAWQLFAAETLPELLTDESVPLSERAEAWLGASFRLVEDVFGETLHPAAARVRFARLKSLVERSLPFFSDPLSLKELSRLMAGHMDVYRHGLATMALAAGVMATHSTADEALQAACATGALLHDMGKTRLPPELAAADPAGLSPDKLAAYRAHPVIGVSICSLLPLPGETVTCILLHHERGDGSGYPSGAVEGDIPFYAKVVAACDAYDNLTRAKSGRRAMAPAEALGALREGEPGLDKDAFRRLVLVLADADIVR